MGEQAEHSKGYRPEHTHRPAVEEKPATRLISTVVRPNYQYVDPAHLHSIEAARAYLTAGTEALNGVEKEIARATQEGWRFDSITISRPTSASNAGWSIRALMKKEVS